WRTCLKISFRQAGGLFSRTSLGETGILLTFRLFRCTSRFLFPKDQQPLNEFSSQHVKALDSLEVSRRGPIVECVAQRIPIPVLSHPPLPLSSYLSSRHPGQHPHLVHDTR